MDIITGNVGWIEVICGPMFSGKSEELIRRLRRAMIARKRVEVFKPSIDNRYSDDEIVSHGDLRMKSQVVANAGRDHRAHRLALGSGGHRRSQFHGPATGGRGAAAGRQRQAGDHRRPRHRLPGPALRAHPRPAGACRIHHQDAGHLRALRQPRQAHAAAARLRRADRGGRGRHVRGPLPPLLRARHPQADGDGFRARPKCAPRSRVPSGAA